jgi:hypothetical protein
MDGWLASWLAAGWAGCCAVAKLEMDGVPGWVLSRAVTWSNAVPKEMRANPGRPSKVAYSFSNAVL